MQLRYLSWGYQRVTKLLSFCIRGRVKSTCPQVLWPITSAPGWCWWVWMFCFRIHSPCLWTWVQTQGEALTTSRPWVAVHLPRSLLCKGCQSSHLSQAACPCSCGNQASPKAATSSRSSGVRRLHSLGNSISTDRHLAWPLHTYGPLITLQSQPQVTAPSPLMWGRTCSFCNLQE